MIEFHCWNCRRRMEAAEAAAGGMRLCPSCGQRVHIPDRRPSEGEASTLPGSAPHFGDLDVRQDAAIRPPRSPSLEIGLAFAGASVLLVGSLLPLILPASARDWWSWDGRFSNGWDLDSFGPVLLALAAAAFAATLSGRSSAVVEALGWGLLVFILASLSRTLYVVGWWEPFRRSGAPFQIDRRPGGAMSGAEVVWVSWVVLLVGPALFLAAGRVGRRREEDEIRFQKEVAQRQKDEVRS